MPVFTYFSLKTRHFDNVRPDVFRTSYILEKNTEAFSVSKVKTAHILSAGLGMAHC
jgi:hypothetical protein